MIYPEGRRGPLEIASTRVTETNTFRSGSYVAMTSSGWALADHTDRTKRALGWIAAADPESFRVVTRTGEIVEWSSHGHGSSGTLLWLGTSGGIVTAKPTGSGVLIEQPVGIVLDADHVQIFPPDPVIY